MPPLIHSAYVMYIVCCVYISVARDFHRNKFESSKFHRLPESINLNTFLASECHPSHYNRVRIIVRKIWISTRTLSITRHTRILSQIFNGKYKLKHSTSYMVPESEWVNNPFSHLICFKHFNSPRKHIANTKCAFVCIN